MEDNIYELKEDGCRICLRELRAVDAIEVFQCESCGQGYHGWHFIAQGQDGHCRTCKQSLLSGIDMNINRIVDFVDGKLQFQAKSKSMENISVFKKIPILLGIIFLSILTFSYFFKAEI